MAARSGTPGPGRRSSVSLPRLLPTLAVVLALAALLRAVEIAQALLPSSERSTVPSPGYVLPSAALIAIAPAAGPEKGDKPAAEKSGDAKPDAPARPTGEDAGNLSAAEIGVLQELAQRRTAIDKRARELGEREAILQAAEKQIEKKLDELKQLKAAVEAALKQQGEEEDGRKRSLVKIFEGMKAPEAARIFEQMDLPQLVDIFERMKERNASAVMAQLHPVRARQVAAELAKRKPVPQAVAAPRPG